MEGKVRVNSAPTPVELERIRRFIGYRERENESLSAGIVEEEDQLVTCSKAISNLEASIPRGKEAIKMHENNLASLTSIQDQFNYYKGLQKLSMQSEPHSSGLYEEMTRFADAPMLRSSVLIDEQIGLLQREIMILVERVENLEAELQGWKSSHELSKVAHQNLMESRDKVTKDLNAANLLLTVAWRVPIPLWEIVFAMVIEGELCDYLAINNENPLRNAALVLSQVCRSWRSTVHRNPNLWKTITVHASQYWSRFKLEMTKHSLCNSPSGVTLVSNLSQKLYWERYYDTYWKEHRSRNSFGAKSDCVIPNGKDTINGKAYGLYLDMLDDQSAYTIRALSIPFQDPLSLTISSRNPLRHDLTKLLSQFTKIQALTIINSTPESIPSITLATALPDVRSISFDFDKFPASFQLTPFLHSALTHISIRQRKDGVLPQLSDEIDLTGLQKLSITYPASNFFEKAVMKHLQELVFYGPSNVSTETFSSSTSAELSLRDLTMLGFEDWTEPQGKETTRGAVASLRRMMVFSSRIQLITLRRCWINGEDLVNLAKSELLREITLSHVCGILREECDGVASLVEKLNIYT